MEMKKKALIVGINNYSFAPLYGCVNDATEIGKLIETNEDHTRNFDVLLKTDVSTRGILRGMIAELFSGNSDVALFYFSGHGFINELGGFLVTPDQRKYDEGISMNDILVLANNSKATSKIIVLDCCHGGAMTAPMLSNNSISHISEGVTILTASKHDEVAVEVNGKGVFTNLFIEALKGGAADINGYITPGSVYAFIDQALGTWEQRPVFKTNVCGFTSIRKVQPRIQLAILRKIVDYFTTHTMAYNLDPSYEYTNDPCIQKDYTAPFAKEENVIIFKALQEMQSAGLVEPVDEKHMYWAAINNKSCKLTALGIYYWRLVNERRI